MPKKARAVRARKENAHNPKKKHEVYWVMIYPPGLENGIRVVFAVPTILRYNNVIADFPL